MNNYKIFDVPRPLLFTLIHPYSNILNLGIFTILFFYLTYIFMKIRILIFYGIGNLFFVYILGIFGIVFLFFTIVFMFFNKIYVSDKCIIISDELKNIKHTHYYSNNITIGYNIEKKWIHTIQIINDKNLIKKLIKPGIKRNNIEKNNIEKYFITNKKNIVQVKLKKPLEYWNPKKKNSNKYSLLIDVLYFSVKNPEKFINYIKDE